MSYKPPSSTIKTNVKGPVGLTGSSHYALNTDYKFSNPQITLSSLDGETVIITIDELKRLKNLLTIMDENPDIKEQLDLMEAEDKLRK